MSPKRKAYTPEFKQEAVKLVLESTDRSLAAIARDIGVNEGTLGNWVARYKLDHAGEEPPLSISERARLRELEKEVRDLRLQAEFLKKAAAFFAREQQ